MAFLAYQTPATVSRKVATPMAIPMMLELSSPKEIEAGVGTALGTKLKLIFCAEVAGAAELLDAEVEAMEALANAAGSGYSVI